MADFTHFNENGRAKMVDVSEKADTVRTAVAAGRVLVNAETFELIKTGGMKKGRRAQCRAGRRDHGRKAHVGHYSDVPPDHDIRRGYRHLAVRGKGTTLR